VAHDSVIGPIVFSLVFDGICYRGILRTEEGPKRFVVSTEGLSVSWFRKLFGLGPSCSTIIKAISPMIPLNQLKLCKDPTAPKKVLAMDERSVVRHFKFGILYVLPHQLMEAEIFSNTQGRIRIHTFILDIITQFSLSIEEASDHYKEFLEFIGSLIELKYWKYFRAGLDTESNRLMKAHISSIT
jgi:RAP1 GTPase activating protein 1